MRKRRVWCGAAILGCTSTAATVQVQGEASVDAPAPDTPIAVAPAVPFRVAAYWENDGAFILKANHNTDRHYTNGAGISLSLQPGFADGLADALGLEADGTAAGLLFGHEMYTPDNLLLDPPDPRDRPYAGYLYAGGFWQRERHDHLDHVQLDLGVVGPSAKGEQVQKLIHDAFSGDDPQGWDAQLEDEFAAQFTYRRKYRHDLPGFDETTDWGHQLLPYAELNLGTVHRNLEAGAMYRVGVRLPDDFGPGSLRDPGSFTAPQLRFDPATRRHAAVEPRGWSAYGFGRVAARYVQWNTFLDGSYADDPSPAVETRPFVGEGQFGFAVAYQSDAHRVALVYSQTWLTHEYEEQVGEDGYGQLTLQWSAGF